MFRANLIAIVFTVLIAFPVNAQWNLKVGTYSTIDNNAFRNYYKNYDIYQSFNMYVSRDIPLRI